MKKLLTIFAIAALSVLTACGDKDEPDVTVKDSSISLSETAVAAGPEGGTYSVKVTSSEGWRVSGFCDWVTFSSTSGSSGQDLAFTVAANPSEAVLVSTFKVFAGSAVQQLTVTSNPSFGIDILSDEAVSVGADAAGVTVTLKTNIPELSYDFGGADWLSLANESEAFGKKIITFDVSRSREFKAREGKISISGEGMSVSVDVTQAQRDTAFVVEGQSIIKGLEALDQTLTIKSNVNLSYSLPSWLSETSAEDADADDTGLRTRTIKVHADACGGSRAATVSFRSGSATVGSVYVKQQNPNPTFANITDPNLASSLESAGWILKDPVSGKSEILEAGLTATSLTVNNMNASSYSISPIASVEGLEAFPSLATLNIGNCSVATVDVSVYPALTELTLLNLRYLESVNLGDRDITSLKCTTSGYGYATSSSVTFKGSKVADIDFSGSSMYIGYGYESSLEWVDVTGCPALTSLNTRRVGNSSWYNQATSLSKIYVTAAQAETVTFTKNDHTEVVVK